MLTIGKMTKQLFRRAYRNETHSQLIRKLFEQLTFVSKTAPVLIEIGAGLTTFTLAEIAKEQNAVFYSCEINQKKIDDLITKLGDLSKNVIFKHGDSLDCLISIVDQHPQIHFVFFDSAPSAMHTFKEFQIVEPCLKPGSCIVIDNAAAPTEKATLTPCRKGKILVPYLLASPFWKVRTHPHSGDSMVSADYMLQPDYADPDYELIGWIDSWKFTKNQ